MTLPSPQEARSRQTAMEAERHWWVQRLKLIVQGWELYDPALSDEEMAVYEHCAVELDALIRERTT